MINHLSIQIEQKNLFPNLQCRSYYINFTKLIFNRTIIKIKKRRQKLVSQKHINANDKIVSR